MDDMHAESSADLGVCTPRETCAEMIRELEMEIGAVAALEESQGVAVTSVRLYAVDGVYFIYRIGLGAPTPYLAAEAPVLLRWSEQRSFPLQVCTRGDRSLTAASTVPLPGILPPTAQLLTDTRWLLDRLRSRLERVARSLAAGTHSEFNAELAQLVVGQGDLDANAIVNPGEPEERSIETLNEPQRQAVRASFEKRVSFLWGPPGTGKTTTVAAIVQAQVEAGRRVLVLAPSNAAADVLALAIAVRLECNAGFADGLMLRIGPRPCANLRRRFGPQVLPSEVAERRAGSRMGPKGNRTPASQLKSNVAAERDALLERCRVAVTPIQNCYLSSQVRGRFDIVVIDEASMASVPQLFLAVGLFAQSRVVIAGDFLQLPAPVAHRRNEDVPWLSTDVFQRMGIPDDVARGDDPGHMVMLTEQYRMSAPISDLVGGTFYGGRLTCSPAIRSRSAPVWTRSASRIVVIDSTPLSPRAERPRGTHSRRNPVHGVIAERLLASLHENGSTPGSVLVISPFVAQVDVLARIVRESGRPAVRASSVYRAQGSEADTVVLSLDDSDGAPTSQFMAARDWSAVGARVLNVGISRARSRLIVIAPVAYLQRCAGPFTRWFLANLLEVADVISADEL